MTKLGETDVFKASDFVRKMIGYMGGSRLDRALINTRVVSEEIQRAYLSFSAVGEIGVSAFEKIT